MEKVVKFEKILFHAADPRKSGPLAVVLGLVYGFISARFLHLPVQTISPIIYYPLLFILPVLGFAVLTNLLLENFYLRRALLLALVSETLLFLGLLFSKLSPSILLFTLGFIYTVVILSVAGVSCRKGPEVLAYSAVYPSLIWALIHLSGILTFSPFRCLYFLGMGISIFLSIHLVEYFFHLSLPDVSALAVFSTFFNKKPMDLDCGKEIDALLQRLEFVSGQDFTIMLPWLHPGPARTLGGGSMSASLIEKLNQDGRGYFWHVPSSHEEDPTSPDISQRILQEDFDDPETHTAAKTTRLLSRESNSFRVYGQKLGDFYLVFIDSRDVDDYDISIFEEIREKSGKKIAFADLHNHPPFLCEELLSHDEDEAQELMETVYSLLDALDEEDQHEFSKGFKVSSDRNFMTMVEEINGDRYLFVTMDINGISQSLMERLEKFSDRERFDEVILLTTDEHRTVEFERREEDIDLDLVKESIDQALEDQEPCKARLSEKELKGVGVLGRDSHFFEAATTFSVHFFPIFLSVVYLAFILFLI